MKEVDQMKKIITFALAIIMCFMCAAVLSSCNKKEDKVLIMGFDAEYPPFTYVENGKYVGFDVEYATKVCESLGYKIEYKAIDWEAKDEALKTGTIDCIWSGFTYEDRENDYAWTVRYLDNTIVVLTNSADITDLASLAGKTVGVQSDSSGETALKKNIDLVNSLKDSKYNTDGSYNVCFEKLKTGAYDAIVIDVGVANYLMSSLSENDAASYSILSEKISTETYGVGFRKEDTELCKSVSDKMSEIAKDANFIKGLCEKYGVDYNSFTLGK